MSVLVRTYSGEVLGRSEHRALGSLFASVPLEGFPFIGHVDPYDDTIFNRLQVNSILAELEKLGSYLGDDEMAAAIEVIDLASLVSERPHRYLVFSGD
ncbi:hypothetical protein [Streptomyces albidoflavus]|uniref:hypothetical protein n=1 Tax=Streptomyces albidoflavus TaxID=1886 RepID=UPI0010228A7B|nr:hypothetical protein [Streptomyces albidoflavus]MBV7648891.1 hypothetical protein [Streptomyces albidoflavus]MBV7710351.1 hypothetical protein [Streptomyces albidoflavus]